MQQEEQQKTEEEYLLDKEAKDEAKWLEKEAKQAENQRKQLKSNLQVQVFNRNHIDSDWWVTKMDPGFPSPIYEYSIQAIRLTNM